MYDDRLIQKKWIVYLGILSVALRVQAEEGIWMGETLLIPFVSGDVTYDDNVFSSETSDEDVFYEYAVGLRVDREVDFSEWQVGLWFAERRYDQYNEKDGTRWGIGTTANLQTDKSYLSGLFDFRQVEDYDDAPALARVPKGFEGTVDKAFDRTSSGKKRDLSDIELEGGQEISEVLELRAAYSFYGVNYDAELEDWYENAAGAEVDYQVTDKTDLFLNVQYGMQDGDGAPDDADFTTARLGLSYAVSEKSNIRLGGGVTEYRTAADDYTEVSFELDGHWLPTSKTTLFVNGRNEVQPTGIDDELKLAVRMSLGARYQATRELTLVTTGSYVHDKDLDGNKAELNGYVHTMLADYGMENGLHFFAKTEITTTKADFADDYERFRGTIGAEYNF